MELHIDKGTVEVHGFHDEGGGGDICSVRRFVISKIVWDIRAKDVKQKVDTQL